MKMAMVKRLTILFVFLGVCFSRGAESSVQEPLTEEQQVKNVLLGCGVKEIVFAARENGKDGHWYANIGYWSYDENNMLYGKGGRLCKLDVETGRMTVLIDDPEGTIRDPAVHYDAGKILFSWRKADSRFFNLYECDVNGKILGQLTDDEYDDIEACYLPDGGIIFVSTRCKRYVNCWLTHVGTIHRCDADGGNIRELSANIEHDNTPWVLPDGRIIYTRWEYIDRSQVDYHHLWTMNPDGTGQMVYFGNMHPPNVYIDARPIPGSDKIVFINSPGHGRIEHAGHVAVVSDEKGPDDLSQLKNISQKASYRDPWPLSVDLFIVSDNKDMVLMNSSGQIKRIYRIPDEFGQGVNIQEPRPVIRRERERIIQPRVNLSRDTGQLILNDVYFGRNMTGVKRGEIKKLLILEALPKPINFTGGMDPLTYGGSFTLERVVGTVPVEEDGSAFMELPANRSFFFVALDENDNSVKRMQSFLTVMPGEVQSCVGCHEERGTTPDNKFVSGRLMSLRRAPGRPEKIEGIPEVFDFPRDIQPILDKHCVKCHNYKERKGGIVLTGDRGPMFSHSYITLTLSRQFSDGRNLARSNYPPRALGTSNSPLMKKIDGSHHKVTVSKQEENMIRYWIETAACYPGTYASLGNGSIGGYQQNEQVNLDKDMPTAAAMREALNKRCAACHNDNTKRPLPQNISHEIGLSFWRFDMRDPRLKFSRHLVFNLTEPGHSLMLLAPLSKKAGGLGLCKRNEAGGPVPAPGAGVNPSGNEAVFETTDDPDYQAILAHIRAGKAYLENELTRFDMPNFRPRREYFREMKRYGILPESFDPGKDKFDVYELDRKYWESLWYKPLKSE